MITVRYWNKEIKEVITVDVKLVEKSEIDFRLYKHIRSVEVAEGEDDKPGWYELYNVCGEVWGYFEADEVA